MSEKRYYWLKLYDSFFENKTSKFICSNKCTEDFNAYYKKSIINKYTDKD